MTTEQEVELRVTLKASEFRSIINSTKYSTAKDSYRPILEYIKIDIRNDKVVAYSCDGCRAARVSLKLDVETSMYFTVFIKPITFSLNVKYVDNVTIGKIGDVAFVEIPTEYGEIRYQFKQLFESQQSHIDLDSIIDSALSSTDRTVSLDSRLLSGITSVFTHRDIHEKGYFKLQTGNDPFKPIVLSTQSDNDKIEVAAILLPVRSI